MMRNQTDRMATSTPRTERGTERAHAGVRGFQGVTERSGSPLRALPSGGAALWLGAAAGLAASCGGGDGVPQPGAPGGVNTQNAAFFFEESNARGLATEMRLRSMHYGRLVQVFGVDAFNVRIPMSDAFIIPQDLQSVAGLYTIETNPVTGQDLFIIDRDVRDLTPNGGLEQFFDILRGTEQSASGQVTLPTVRVADLGTVGVFTMVPRNAAIVLVFDDLIDPRTVDPTTIRINSGYPPTNPFEGRLLLDVHHGALANHDGVPGEEFYSTRVIIDPTISSFEAFATSPPQPINGVGLPASVDATRANLRISLPTVRNAALGQQRVLTNPTNHPLSTTGNGPVDLASPVRPLLRAFRSGGDPDLTADPFNGFLRDEVPPLVVGSNPITLPDAPQFLDGVRFLVPRITFASNLCAQLPEVGDVIVQGGLFAEVVADGLGLVGQEATNIQVRLVQFPANWTGPEEWEIFGIGDATYETAYNPATDVGLEACYLGVSPRPTGFPANPTTGITPFSSFRVRFSEAMDPRSLTAFDSLTLTRTPVPAMGIPSTDQFVIGRVGQTVDLREFTFQPDLPLNHAAGTAESYYMALASGQFAPRDLAGNRISVFDQIEATVDPGAISQSNGGRVSRFVSIDEEFPIAGSGEPLLPEWGGQLLLDPGRQLIFPRPVVRNQVIIDRRQVTLAGHTPFSSGIVTPLSNFGSKMQTLWRYADCGFSINDPTNINVDVEGLGWAPAGGAIVPDAFDEFEIRLSHCRWAPDEIIDPASLFPLYPDSGLVIQYANNLLQNEQQAVVHPRERGYILNPASVFVAPTGTRIMPFPLNVGTAPEAVRTFTWRDTAIRTRTGGLGNGGVDPSYYLVALGIVPPPPAQKFYPPNEVQTIGLPLLLEFRTFRDDSAVGVNGFDINLAANSSSKPYFRAFSTGGIRQNGQPQYINPDSVVNASGGFNPGSANPGAVTYGLDNSVYLGSLDLVVRVSRAHSVWFRSVIAGETTFSGRNYLPATVEPRAEDQPIGTSIEVHYRGATAIEYRNQAAPSFNDNDGGPGDNPIDPITGIRFTDYQINGFRIDLYGDYYNEVDSAPLNIHSALNANPGLTFLGGIQDWRATSADIANATFYQVRLTFLANIATGESPELSAFAISWTQ